MKEILKRGLAPGSVVIETGNWHEGILGIVAGRLTEDYKKPAFALTETEAGIFKGSGRSFGDFNLAKALEYAKDSIISGGGHAGAAGVKIAADKLYEFREKINAYYDSLNLTDQEKYLKVSADLEIDDLTDINTELVEDLKLLEPFGPGNEEPIFCIKKVTVTNKTRMGEDQNHLRLDIEDKKGNILKLIAFYAPEKWLTLDPKTPLNILFKPVENEFRSVRSVEGRIVDIYF